MVAGSIIMLTYCFTGVTSSKTEKPFKLFKLNCAGLKPFKIKLKIGSFKDKTVKLSFNINTATLY